VCCCNAGLFGVPLDVCAQSLYRAISALAEKVFNLSLREVHLVNIHQETTQIIQSVFYQLASSPDDSERRSVVVAQENLQARLREPECPSSPSTPSVGANLERHEDEVLDFRPKDVQLSARETSPDRRNTPDAAVMEEDRQSSAVAAPQDSSEISRSLDGKKIPENEEEAEGQELAIKQSQDPSSGISDAEDRFDDDDDDDDDDDSQEQQTSLVVEPVDRKLENTVQVPAIEKVWNDEDEEDQSFEAKICDDQKSLENSQAMTDQEETESASKEKVLEKDRERCENSVAGDGNDTETGERVGCDEEEERCCWSSKPEAELEAFMQELNLEEYRETESASLYHEQTQVVPSD